MVTCARFSCPMQLTAPILSLAMHAQSGDSQWVEKLAFWLHSDLRRVEERLVTIDTELSALPALTQINSSGSIGFKTSFQQGGGGNTMVLSLRKI